MIDANHLYTHISHLFHCFFGMRKQQLPNVRMVLCILSGIIVILCNMLAQAINEQIDPRIRAKQMTEESEVVRR